MRQLSKSKIIAYRQCAKRLWLEVHRPALRVDSEETLARFQVGYQVGDVARRIYDPKGQGAVIDVEREGFDRAFARSARLLAESAHPVFEAGFKIAGALAFADVMLPVTEKRRRAWRMVEVKSSTSVKDYHRDDAAVQTFIARTAGVPVSSVALACIDSSWTYPGDLNYNGLLVETDLTAEVNSRSDEVRSWLAEAQKVVARASEPSIDVGDHCHDPFECGFCTYCNRDKPQPKHPLDWLPNLSAARRGQLAEEGVMDLSGVSDEWLNERQRIVRDHTLAETVFFDGAGAAAALAAHSGYPRYFLDFETIQFAVPIWKGTRPYQQIPFQFSLHVAPRTGRLEHRSFLDLSGNDPTKAFASALLEGCGDKGPVFTYNAAFEKSRINDLAERYPRMARELRAINERVVDLLPVARNHYYHPSQQGSWSIKAVLPAAVPELSYAALGEVADGGTAMDAYAEAIRPDCTSERKTEIAKKLHAYCRLDTFAMVRLWQFFSGRNELPLKDVL